MLMKNKRQKKKAPDITLRDVVNHMSAMEQRLSGEIGATAKEIVSVEQRLSAKIETNTKAVHALTQRIDALEEDLTATILDTIKIRGHVGMPVPSDS